MKKTSATCLAEIHELKKLIYHCPLKPKKLDFVYLCGSSFKRFFMAQLTQTSEIDETDGLPLHRRIWAVVGISFALCMSVLDINIINVVLPTLSHDFGTSPAVTTWIINGYQLAIVISLLSFSSLGEIYGYRKIFLSGIAMFIVTSLICALSHSFWTLTLARIFQGFSASAITSVIGSPL